MLPNISQIADLLEMPDYLIFVAGITLTVSDHPDSPDPYEEKYVSVTDSLIPGAGQGLFTRQEVDKGRVIAYFAGVAVEGLEAIDSEYSITWLEGARLDIPPKLLASYTSTRGHKACHSFAPNCEYTWAVHPRFGRIRAITTIRQMEAGEEVYTDYRYSINKAPLWYKEDLRKFLVDNHNMKSSDIEEYINKAARSASQEERLCPS